MKDLFVILSPLLLPILFILLWGFARISNSEIFVTNMDLIIVDKKIEEQTLIIAGETVSSESYSFVVEFGENIQTVSCTKEEYEGKEVGDTISCYIQYTEDNLNYISLKQ